METIFKKQNIMLIIIYLLTFYSFPIEIAAQEHSLSSRKFQGIPSLAISPNGRLWATWYAGKTPGEDKNNYVVVSSSFDNGITWTEEFIVDPDGDGPLRAFDPEIWIDPDGRLWSFWAQTINHDGTIAGLWAKTNDNPDDKNSQCSEPRRITDGIMMCKPTVLSSGEWILPASTWRDTDNSARVVISTDNGQTFSIRGACNVPKDVRNYDEHMIIEKMDRSLWMLVRTSYGIGESFSIDRGKTWSPLLPSAIQHPSARFFIRRLLSGNLLLVKHGPINERTDRSYLTAYLSKDDGHTWEGGLLLDDRTGVSYPDGQQTSDGKIYIIYDYSRTKEREILMSTFTEEDLVSGNTESSTVSLRVTVSKYSTLRFDSKKVFINKATVNIFSQLKDSEIRYTTDETEPNQNSRLYTEPFNVNETSIIRIKEFTKDGLSHPIYDAHYIKENPIKALSVNPNICELSYEYFNLREKIDSLAELSANEPTQKGIVKNFTFPKINKKFPQYFGLKFSGYINIPKEDVYRFSVLSNDGSRLFVADKLIVNNDGPHGANEEFGEIALQKGLHNIELLYFQAGGSKELKVFWQSSGFEKREITKEDLSCE